MGRYDLLVIGGGINGLGVASDAAARGLSVLIVEKNDWGGGTTSASSRLIHGGLRYLQYGEIDLVRESLRERGILARQRPHLIHPISLLIPTYRSAPLPKWMVGTGLLMYDVLARDPMFPRPAVLGLTRTIEREPYLNRDGLTGGFTYPDAQIEFPERICVEMVQETVAAGGVARNHTRVTGLREENGRVVGATLLDELTGETEEVEAAQTINAGGPWVDVVNRSLKRPIPKMIGGTWGTHLVLPARPGGGPRGSLYANARKDGRPFFILPWDERLLVGTTDVKFEGQSPDELKVQDWEIQYLLDETNTLFPGAAYAPSDIEVTTIGIRPLPASGEKSAGAITRRHFLVDHGEKHGVAGIASIVGGKLTTYRSLAEEVVDWTLRTLGRPPVPSSTGVVGEVTPLPDQVAAVRAEMQTLGLDPAHAARLVALYGPVARDVLKRVARDPSLGRPLGPNTPHLEAQVAHAASVEFARTVEDVVHRRLMLFPPTEEAVAGVRRVIAERGLKVAG
ncbi:MAG TPA: glycerol-3-phosphate dehydrogenase/oxidase [Armatimonadaceae bacterium]|nr:glycerol-3-phosphate dehydrogenase/oxidase [Armatimonadaceae bacterium]